MKKLMMLLSCIMITAVLFGQSNDKKRQNIEIYKPSPTLILNGSGAQITFNSTITLVQSTGTLTLGGANLALGTNSLTMTGSIGATGARITKGWFTNLEITNSPTINGTSIASIYSPITNPVFLGNVGISTTGTAQHRLSIVSTVATSLNNFNLVEGDINKNRTTAAQARDTSSMNMVFSPTGSPTLTVNDKTGTTIFKVDSVNVTTGVAVTLTTGDTTVTAVLGKIVYKSSANHFYGCVNTGTGRKWKQLDN